MAEPKPTSTPAKRRYLRAPVPVHFPTTELAPQTGVHMRLCTDLWTTLTVGFGDRAIVGSNQFLYWDPTDPQQRLAPDVLLWFGEPNWPFDSWKVWERGAPHLSIEVVSAEDARDHPWQRNLDAYQRSGVRELVRFDPEDAQTPLRLWDRLEGELIERTLSKQELERSNVLGLYWIVERDPEFGHRLFLSRDAAGRERLRSAEDAYRARARPAEDQPLGSAAGRILALEARIRELEAELARRSGG